jgi:type IV pilus assembly protein PilM
MTQPNIVDPAAFARSLATVVERAGALGGGDVGLVLPDPVVRLALLPASDVNGGSRRETEDLIRFRLRKALPFEAQEARVAYQDPPAASGGQVLVAAIFRPVLEAYEQALGALGLRPGLVEAASLALAGGPASSGASGDRFFLNWDHGYVSLVLSRAGWPILLRTLTGDFAASPEPVIREVANTILYYQERLAGPGLERAVVRSAALPPDEAVTLLQEPLGLKAEILDPWAPLGGSDTGPAAQALAGAAACLARAA